MKMELQDGKCLELHIIKAALQIDRVNLVCLTFNFAGKQPTSGKKTGVTHTALSCFVRLTFPWPSTTLPTSLWSKAKGQPHPAPARPPLITIRHQAICVQRNESPQQELSRKRTQVYAGRWMQHLEQIWADDDFKTWCNPHSPLAPTSLLHGLFHRCLPPSI